jgi:putative nucleotidyltransferase with HDIG domain
MSRLMPGPCPVELFDGVITIDPTMRLLCIGLAKINGRTTRRRQPRGSGIGPSVRLGSSGFNRGDCAPIRAMMSLDLSYDEQLHLADNRRNRVVRMTRRERIAELVSAAALAAGCGALWIVDPPTHVSPLRTGLTLLVLALALRVRFETPFGFTSAAQLAFVPLVFALPPALVPIGACVTVVIAWLPDVVRGELRWSRLLRMPTNAWFSLGPAWVLGLADPHDLRTVPILLAALAAQFAIDLVSSSLMLAATESLPLSENLGDSWVYGVDAALSGVAFAVAMLMRSSAFAVLTIVPMLGLLAMFARERSSRLSGLLELGETYRGTALLLGDVVEADDAYTGMHSQGVVQLVVAVADRLNLNADRRRNVEFAALLHDVGKIAIPKEIINKPGKLDEQEWAIMKSHAAEGERMLRQVGGFMNDVASIVRSHHERWDGGGYPDGLIGEIAPLESRIITCCDSWSAMRTTRPYRQAMPYADAVAEVERHTGTQFDPVVAAALLAVVAEHDREADGGPLPVALTSATYV